MANMTIRPLLAEERKYTYAQSQQLTMQTGSIGYLRADMDSNGQGFFSSWTDHCPELKTQSFKDEFDEVINTLREDESLGGILKNRDSLGRYCRSHPESRIGAEGREFGFRVDTQAYSYMLRLNPNKGEYNLYCYCYLRERLDRHLEHAGNGIRFITPDYKEVFRIPDGDRIRITTADGEIRDRTCRYIDDCHLEIESGFGYNLYHICEFAERVVHTHSSVIPLRSSLPKECMSVHETTGQLIFIRRGEKGFRFSDTDRGAPGLYRTYVDMAHKKEGISRAQEAAMVAGSMFGWEKPAADPKNYDENGQPLRPRRKDRGDAR